MSIFAIGDLHLPGGDKKPMDVFGAHWERHFERICADWQSRVKPEDIVLIPGDISWAMQLGDALNDLREIAKLPGTILLLRGNHDFWWSSLSQLRACLPKNMHAMQNDAFDAGECVFCGTRGWTIPLGQNAAAQDEKLYRREALRLEMSLKDAARIYREELKRPDEAARVLGQLAGELELAEGDEDRSEGLDAAGATPIDAADVPTEGGEDKVESAAHPS